MKASPMIFDNEVRLYWGTCFDQKRRWLQYKHMKLFIPHLYESETQWAAAAAPPNIDNKVHYYNSWTLWDTDLMLVSLF